MSNFVLSGWKCRRFVSCKVNVSGQTHEDTGYEFFQKRLTTQRESGFNDVLISAAALIFILPPTQWDFLKCFSQL